MIPYIFHVSLLIATFYALYRLLWEKETFFQLNRWILITCLLLSFGLPWLTIPEEWSLQNRVVQQEVLADSQGAVVTLPSSKTKALNPVITTTESLKESASAQPEILKQKEIETAEKEAPLTSFFQETWLSIKNLRLDFWQVVQYIYVAGLVVFIINFLIQLMLILFQKATNPTLKDGQFTIVEINQDKAPFSFGNSIFINPTKYDWDTYTQIIEHEKIHIEQRHSFDIVLAELMLIVQWFNPFAWFYRKAVENNLEYLTDSQMLYKGTERRTYQMNLLRVSVPQLPLNLTTNYNQSFLKRRIAMMNVKKSSASSSWKYLLLFPLLALTVITLNPIELQSQNGKKIERTEISETLDSDTTATEIKEIPAEIEAKLVDEETSETEEHLLQERDGEVADEETTLNDGPEVNIQGHASFEMDSMVLYKGLASVDGQMLRLEQTGNWTGDISKHGVCFQIMHAKRYDRYRFSVHTCIDNEEINPRPTANAQGPFSIKRDAGTLELRGEFEDGEGYGKYTFTENKDFIASLEREGYDLEDRIQIHLFLADINKSYLSFLKDKGYGKLSEDELEALAYHQITQKQITEYLDGLDRMNFDKPDLDELVELVIHDVSLDYIEKMGRDLYKDLTIRQIVEASIHDVKPAYIKEIRDLGYDDISFKQIVEFSIHDIDADYIKELKDAGLELNRNQIVEAAIHNVNADYIKKVNALGYDDLEFREIVEFSIHDIDANYIKELKDAGLDLRKKEIIEAAIHDVDANYIKKVRALGYDDLEFREIVEFSIHDIDADYIKELKSSGLDLSKKQIVEAAIHNVDAGYIKKVRALGYDDIEFRDIIEFSIHDIDADYIKELKSAGLKNLTKKQIVEAAIHDIDADFIKAFEDMGFSDLNFKDIVNLGIHDVDARFIKKMRDAGYKDLSPRELTEAKIHDIDPDDLEGYAALGFDNISLRKLIELKIHNVTPSYIKRIQKSGAFKDLSLDEYIEMKIHGIDRKMKRE